MHSLLWIHSHLQSLLSTTPVSSAKVPTRFLQGLDFDDAAKRFWILDKNGLITRKRPNEDLTDVVRPFAAVGEDDIEGEDLLSVVKRVRCLDLDEYICCCCCCCCRCRCRCRCCCRQSYWMWYAFMSAAMMLTAYILAVTTPNG